MAFQGADGLAVQVILDDAVAHTEVAVHHPVRAFRRELFHGVAHRIQFQRPHFICA